MNFSHLARQDTLWYRKMQARQVNQALDLAESIWDPWEHSPGVHPYWSGSLPQEGWKSQVQTDHEIAQMEAIRETVCSVVGHQMIADPEIPQFQECLYCGGCNISECCGLGDTR